MFKKAIEKKARRVKVCPKCRSPKLRHATITSGWLTSEYYICDSCGYKGPLYVEIDVEELEKLKKEEKKK